MSGGGGGCPQYELHGVRKWKFDAGLRVSASGVCMVRGDRRCMMGFDTALVLGFFVALLRLTLVAIVVSRVLDATLDRPQRPLIFRGHKTAFL